MIPYRLISFFLFLISLLISIDVQSQNRKLHELEIKFDSTSVLAPGGVIPIGVVATKNNGKQLITRGYLKGNGGWSKYKVAVEGGKFVLGKIFVYPELYRIKNDQVTVTVSLKKDTSFKKTLAIDLNYINTYVANYTGTNGRDGYDGNSPSCGGCDGGDGSHGENGRDGEVIDVLVKKVSANAMDFLMIKVRGTTSGKNNEYKVNVKGGGLILDVSGGNGGKGGRGGDGASGVDVGNGGDGGDGGWGGDGGHAGIIRIVSDSASEAYLSLLTLKALGGTGGKAGKKGRGGSAGPNRQQNAKTIVGKILEGSGAGKNGDTGSDGKQGRETPDTELVILKYHTEY
jgi:hypothetical protein